MSRGRGRPSKAFERLIKQYKDCIEELANEVGKEIEDAYEDAIIDFYLDYSPKYYQRTESLFYGSSGFKNRIPVVQNIGKDLYKTGITVSEQFYENDPYRADTIWVFENAFLFGIHGFDREHVKEVNSNRTKDEWWRPSYVGTPGRMRPSPEHRLRVRYKRVTNSRRLRKRLNEIIEEKVF